MEKKTHLPIGTRVMVRRINREEIQGFVTEGPLEYLIKIGEFYIIGYQVWDEEKAPYYCGRGRKSKERLEYEAQMGTIGMYERAYIQTV